MIVECEFSFDVILVWNLKLVKVILFRCEFNGEMVSNFGFFFLRFFSFFDIG